jgi:hypothetical protein
MLSLICCVFIDTFEQVPLTSSQLCVRRDDCLQDYASDNDEDDGPHPTDPPTAGQRVKTKRVRPVRFLGRCGTHLCDKDYGVVVPGERVLIVAASGIIEVKTVSGCDS